MSTSLSTRLFWAAVLLLAFFACAPRSHATVKYWRGTAANSDRWELDSNWSTQPKGLANTVAPTATDVAVFSFSGTTVRIRSKVTVGGILLSNVWTGSLLQGTGSLVVKSGSGGLRVGSGTFVGSNTGMTLPQLTMTGGIMRNLQGNMTVTGALSITYTSVASKPATSFSMTGGTIIMAGKANQALTNGDASSSVYFNAMTLNNTGTDGSANVITPTRDLLLHGALTITLGRLDMEANQKNLSVSGAIALADSSAARLISLNTITASGSVTAGASGIFNISGSTLVLNGIAQTLTTGNALVTNLTATRGTTVTLGGAVRVSGTVTVGASTTLALSSSVLAATGSTIANSGTISEGTGKIVHTSATTVGASSYTIGSPITFTVTDSDENIDGTVADTVTISVTGADDGPETLTLTETAVASGVFDGTITTSHALATPGNGTLESKAFATFNASGVFTDAQDSGDVTSGSAVVTDSAAVATSGASSGGGGGGSRGGGGGGGGGSTAATTTTSTITSRTTNTSQSIQKAVDRVTTLMQNVITRLEKRGATPARIAKMRTLMQNVISRLQKRAANR